MTAAASGPWPIASPMISAVRPPGSATMSCQSPPTMLVPTGRYRAATSRPSGTRGSSGTRPCCSTKATRRSRWYSRALSMHTAACAASSAATSVSGWVKPSRPTTRANVTQPSTTPRAISGTDRNEV